MIVYFVFLVLFCLIFAAAAVTGLLWVGFAAALPALGVFWLGGKAAAEQLSAVSECSLLRSEFGTLAQNISDGVVVYSHQFKILYVNRVTEQIFNIKATECVGQKISPQKTSGSGITALTRVIFPLLADSVTQISESGEWPQIADISTNEPKLNLRVTLDKITDGGSPAVFIKTIHDNTREGAVFEEKTEFINTAAHQLRTPLTVINWALENIKNITSGKLPEAERAADDAMIISARALKITNDLLDAAKIEEGRFGYKFSDLDLVQLVQDAVEQIYATAKQKDITIYFEHAGLESLPASMDGERIGLAISNVLDNAIKYNNPNGMVKISLGSDGENAIINVVDSGNGIPAEELKNLFKKFFRGTNAEQLEPNGSGLGLFITKNIIDRHGGKIYAESQQGRGTMFKLLIPLKRANIGAENKREE
ncbi:hypothetical protein A3D55_03210 [Candidatus Jorgensenbacteria bacterium RIFCSPHIGHO2_02_FULL_45_20]|nr:MAG: hypothetical protein A3D55_03210 [Candidatus Jorgensenbacteria bacterium RIFCSPHIGHO2_02_FULL_45_20]